MPDSVADPTYKESTANLERKLKSLPRDINGIAELGKTALSNLDDTALFEARLEVNLVDWDKFQCCWDDFSELRAIMEDESNSQEWQQTYDSLRDEILEAKACLLRIERRRRSQAAPPAPDVSLNRVVSDNSRTGILPTVPLPQFSGDLAQWSNFKSTFKSLVHNDPTLANVVKFHYLVGALKNEAASLISGFPKEETFYEQAWNKLVSTYDNPRVLASMLVHRILDSNSRKESNEEKRYESFLSEVADSVEAFRALKLDQPAEFLLSTLVLRALDPITRKQFELSLKSNESIPSTDDIIKFVRHRKTALKMAQDSSSSSTGIPSSSSSPKKELKGRFPWRSSRKYQSVSLHSASSASSSHSGSESPNVSYSPATAYSHSARKSATVSCLQCRGTHHLSACKAYEGLPLHRRVDKAKSWRVCFNCLSKGHVLSRCTSKFNCRKCAKRHHTLLHGDPPRDEATPQSNDNDAEKPKDYFTGFGSSSASKGTVLLGTVRTFVKGQNGDLVRARAVLDSGSQQSFVTSSLASRLGYKLQPHKGTITSLAGAAVPQQFLRGSMSCTLRPCHENEQFQIQTIVVDRITSALPNRDIPPHVVSSLKAHHLADPDFGKSAPVDLLLGGDIFPRIVLGASFRSEVEDIYLLPTSFGLVVSGKLHDSTPVTTQVFFTESCSSIEDGIKRFWEVEEPQSVDRTRPEDKYCEDHFVHTYSRNPTGRFVVRLPLKSEPEQIGNNRDLAIRRFLNLEQKLQRDTLLKQHYAAFMREYSDLKHMSTATTESPYLIPHHGVWQYSPYGTKLRVVFDASCPSPSGSLNDMLLAGPKLQGDLCSILIRFRLHPIALCADLVKMYRQILVHPSDRHLQHIVWRETPADPLQEEELNTVTYGLRPSAFQAIRVLQELVSLEGSQYPLAAAKVETDMYVDEVVTGVDSEEEAVQLRSELQDLFSKGGFTLSKWASTLPHLLPPEERAESRSIRSPDDDQFKILGLRWSPSSDSFGYNVREPPVCNLTKHAMLSAIARIFDPLGLLAPVIFVAKSLIQSVWKTGLDWDQELPPELSSDWRQLTSEWHVLSHLSIKRYIVSSHASITLVGFCDASTKGYAAALYLRCEAAGEAPKSSLIKAKTKVAPLKFMSVARLELCGALLLSRLISSAPGSLKHQVACFTDSKVVLAWLNTPFHDLKVFEANRVSQIIDVVPPHLWQHVSSENNPADVASRGCTPKQLVNDQLWWSGPSWLHNDVESWFKPDAHDVTLTGVVKSRRVPDDEWFSRFSSLKALVRTVARMLRWPKLTSIPDFTRTSAISADEYADALKKCIALAQREHLSAVLFTGKAQIPHDYAQLSPFRDKHGLIKIGGRLHEAPLDESAKHQLLVPQKSHLARLIIKQIHDDNFHCGSTLSLSLLRAKYWIPRARKLIRSCISRCVRCRIRKAQPTFPLMAPLPKERFSQLRTFEQVGIDYAGPFLLKESSRRKAPVGKAYLCLFVCMASKALHLEIVSSLTTASFLDALDRFMARRRTPSCIHSDHGTNFVGASRFLKDVHEFLTSNEDSIIDHLAPHGINWKFIPPRAPHFGGLWEAGVKSVKNLMVSALGSQPYTFEDLTTATSKIECVLNSRPLCPLTEDPYDFDYLTPGHFLIGGTVSLIPQPSSSSDPPRAVLAAWRSLQAHIDHIWERWRKEYLHTLQQRGKWTRHFPNVKVGDLVILQERRTLIGRWPVGRVTQVFPGKDGIVRTANVLTPAGNTLTRAVTSLTPLFSAEEKLHSPALTGLDDKRE